MNITSCSDNSKSLSILLYHFKSLTLVPSHAMKFNPEFWLNNPILGLPVKEHLYSNQTKRIILETCFFNN